MCDVSRPSSSGQSAKAIYMCLTCVCVIKAHSTLSVAVCYAGFSFATASHASCRVYSSAVQELHR